jgi:UDP-N-acetyl-D-glucosamine dehydrogenase
MITQSFMDEPVYRVPEDADDKDRIQKFLERNKGKKVVAIQGLGFVGSVMALVVANALHEEYAVIGVDRLSEATYWKIASINEGKFPIEASDKKIQEFFTKAISQGNLYATVDPFAYAVADIVVIDINLDVVKNQDKEKNITNYGVDLDPFKKAIETIGQSIREHTLILVESTVPPGTCQKVIKPILDKAFSDRGLKPNYKLGHSYERVMPGPNYVDSIQNFYRVYSGIDESSADAVEQFLKTIIRTDQYPLTRLGNTAATEMAKVLENSFRATNIAFIQEWTEFAERAGVNLYEVINAIRMRPTHKNIMMPGLGVGGYCLPKDPLLASWSSQNLFNGTALKQSEAAVGINDRMPLHAFQILEKEAGPLAGKKILLLGVSYLKDVGDTRYSPVEWLYDLLMEAGAELRIHDPFVSVWEEKRIKVSNNLKDDLSWPFDLLIFCTNHTYYFENDQIDSFLLKLSGKFILDTAGMLTSERIEKYRLHHAVKVLGRGDL